MFETSKISDLRRELSNARHKKNSPKRALALSTQGIAMLREGGGSQEDLCFFICDFGWALEHLGRYDEALIAVTELQRQTNDHFGIWRILVWRAQLKEKQGDLQGALEECNKQAEYYFQFIINNPERDDSVTACIHWKQRAKIQFKLGLYDAIIPGFDDLIKTDPRHPVFWWARADMCALLKRYEEAITDYTKALSFTEDRKSSNYLDISIDLIKTQKLEAKARRKQEKTQPQTQPTHSAPLAHTKTQPTPSAPPAGTQTRRNFFFRHPTPSAPPLTAPIKGNDTQETIAPENLKFIPLDAITFGEELGSGGMGVVYRGKIQGREAPVAIKVTHQKFEQPVISHEYKLLSTLQHPNIIDSIGFTMKKEGQFCFIMECQPFTLSTYIFQTHRSPAHRLFPIIGVSDGLHFLHNLKNKLVHGDIKSENILIREDGTAVIADFGISRRLLAGQTHQSTTTQAGTISHLAPEIFNPPKGQNGKVHYGSPLDIYALGILLWECLAEQYPYPQWPAATIITHVLFKEGRPDIPTQKLEGEMGRTPTQALVTSLNRFWHQDPKKRPTAAAASEQVRSVCTQLKK